MVVVLGADMVEGLGADMMGLVVLGVGMVVELVVREADKVAEEEEDGHTTELVEKVADHRVAVAGEAGAHNTVLGGLELGPEAG